MVGKKPFTFLVAFTVNADNEREAQLVLIDELHEYLPINRNSSLNGIESWWVAEDERFDRSDNESAIFIPRSISQSNALVKIHNLGKSRSDGCC